MCYISGAEDAPACSLRLGAASELTSSIAEIHEISTLMVVQSQCPQIAGILIVRDREKQNMF
jgi:hypothetical protein